MRNLNYKEKRQFLSLFVRDGYVLDFNTADFDIFTMKTIGLSLCSYYRCSKGKSLTKYVNDASEDDVIKLLFALYDYYEERYEGEYNENKEEDYFDNHLYNENYAKSYKKCREIVESIRGIPTALLQNGELLKEKFSSEYLKKQIDSMIDLQIKNPTDAIGKAKELIESCCKTILENEKIEWDKNWDMSKLTGETLKHLDLTPKAIPDTDPVSGNIKAVLGNLRGITTKLAEIRNPYGSGHGKSDSFTGLETRHAKLAVGCSITFVTFLWDTYEGGVSK